jgi:hypothetical protein
MFQLLEVSISHYSYTAMNCGGCSCCIVYNVLLLGDVAVIVISPLQSGLISALYTII